MDPAEGEKGQVAFAQSLNLPFPLLPDTGRNISLLYGATTDPNGLSGRMSVLIDKNGIVRWIDRAVRPATHGPDVLIKIAELSMTP